MRTEVATREPKGPVQAGMEARPKSGSEIRPPGYAAAAQCHPPEDDAAVAHRHEWWYSSRPALIMQWSRALYGGQGISTRRGGSLVQRDSSGSTGGGQLGTRR